MLTKNDIGKKIIMFRKPTPEEWMGIGEVKIQHLLTEGAIFKDFGTGDDRIYVNDETGYVYPICCFKLFEQIPDYEIY